MDLDLKYVRSQFPVFATSNNTEAFFENAGGSYACRQTITALNDFYVNTKVQPYADYAASASGGQAMDHSRQRWADALGVEFSEVQFGPSTSINTYVLANAFRATLKPGDEIIVTNQDHEANTGALRRAAKEAGAIVREWRIVDGVHSLRTGFPTSPISARMCTCSACTRPIRSIRASWLSAKACSTSFQIRGTSSTGSCQPNASHRPVPIMRKKPPPVASSTMSKTWPCIMA